MKVRSILIVDDERHLRSALFSVLTRLGHAVEAAENGLEALEKFKTQQFDLVISDLKMPKMDGLELLKTLKNSYPNLPFIMITAYGTVENAVSAMREGADDFILKPFPSKVIETAVERLLNKIDNEENINIRPSGVKKQIDQKKPLISKNSKMLKLLELAKKVAPSQATVLLQGESGTGKELLARYIHNHSGRSQEAFVAVNCASLPEHLLESELFGHEKGAFTGAISRKQGKFELADNGTILLDEISEMDIALQAKLLRVLQEGEIDRVGGKEAQKINVRVIATTNRNLKQWVDEGHFRADLYYRLNVIPFFIPPLRERLEDIKELAELFISRYSSLNQKEIIGLSPAALESLKKYSWPGNIRELENTVARGVLLATGKEIEEQDLFLDEAGFMSALENKELDATNNSLQIEIKNDNLSPEDSMLFKDNSEQAVLNDGENQGVITIEEMERRLIGLALNETSGNRTHAAKLLGISVRTLRNKLAEYRA